MRIFPKFTAHGLGFALLRVTIASYLLLGLVIYFRQDKMLYFPDQTPFADCAELASTTQVDMNGTRGYFFQNGTSTKLAVLYHGNAGRACERAFYRTALEHAGYSWLFVEYAGYAGDVDKNGEEITPSTKAILRDAQHVHEWVLSQRPSALAVVGESIGSGPASYHASLSAPDALILIAPLDKLSLRAQEAYLLYPVRFILKNDFDNITWAQSAKRVLIIHGTADTIISITHGENLFAQLPQVEKEFLAIPNVDHNEVFGSVKTQHAILQFLKNWTLK